MFTPAEREAFLREALADYANVYVDRFNELVVEFARRWEANVILKGLRAISDFEYEFAMAQLNRKLAPDIETVFMMASPEHSFLSSSGVKEIATFGGRSTTWCHRRWPAASRRCIPAKGVGYPRRGRLRMDVLVLIDKLDDIIHNARSVPLTDSVMIDREEIYDLLDQMRSTIPEEIKQARWIVKERQEMLAEAKQESERIVAEARSRPSRLASQEEVVRLAERKAHEIIEDAREREREIRLGAEDYADEVLGNLEVNLDKFLAAVRRGRERLQGARRSTTSSQAVSGDGRARRPGHRGHAPFQPALALVRRRSEAWRRLPVRGRSRSRSAASTTRSPAAASTSSSPPPRVGRRLDAARRRATDGARAVPALPRATPTSRCRVRGVEYVPARRVRGDGDEEGLRRAATCSISSAGCATHRRGAAAADPVPRRLPRAVRGVRRRPERGDPEHAARAKP